MKKIIKSKAGFTLLEMIMVVAIVVILAGVMVMSIGTYVQNAKARSAMASAAQSSAVVNIQSSDARMSELGFDRITSGGSSI